MKNSNERTVKESASERGTTMKTFFSPDFHLFKEIDQVQDSLGNNKNFSHLNKFQLNFDYYQPSEEYLFSSEKFLKCYKVELPQPSTPSSSSEQFNWLTAEDILKAAEDSDSKITHSPIVLIPYEEMSQDNFNLDLNLETFPNKLFDTNFAILDSLSSQLLEGNEISSQVDERVG